MAKRSVPESVPAYVRLFRELRMLEEGADRSPEWAAHVQAVFEEEGRQRSGPCLRLVACPGSQAGCSPKFSQAHVRTPHLRLVVSRD